MSSIKVGSHYRGKYIVRGQISSWDLPSAQHYLVENTHAERVEILKRGRPGFDPGVLRGIFKHEAEMLNHLRGPFVGTLFSPDLDIPEFTFGLRQNCPLLAQCLANLANFAPAFEQQLKAAHALQQLVAFFHEHKVVVGNLDPSNLIAVPATNRNIGLMIVDVSYSHKFGAEPVHVPQSSRFMPPETGQKRPTGTAGDIYALGVIFLSLFGGNNEALPKDLAAYQKYPVAALRKLVQSMVADVPADRPEINEVRRALVQCELAYEEARNDTGAYCPSCRAKVLVAGATKCDQCNTVLSRATRQLIGDSSSGADPAERLYKADQNGSLIDIVFWARDGLRHRALSANARLRAFEAALELPGELDFASTCLKDFPVHELTGEAYFRYPAALGHYFWISNGGISQCGHKKMLNAFSIYRNLWDQAVHERPQTESLWRWLILATPWAERLAVIRRALQYLPKSPWIYVHLGDCHIKDQQFEMAMECWYKAAELGLNELAFLIRTYQLTDLPELINSPRVAEIRAALLTQLRSRVPQTVDEFMVLIKLADSHKDNFQKRKLLDDALRLFPGHTGLREVDAFTLYDDAKYELVINRYGDSANTATLLRLVGLSEFGCKLYEKAQRRLCGIAMGERVEGDYYCITRAQIHCDSWVQATFTLEEGLKRFPQSDQLRRLKSALISRVPKS